MCLYSKLIDNPKYKATKKNGGVIPLPPDERVKKVPIGCGQCLECLKEKQRSWTARLLFDITKNKNGKFITLTFSDEQITSLLKKYPKIRKLHGYAKDNAIATKATRLFLERHRKQHKHSLRHWLVTELGHKGTNNVHLHGIIWTNDTLEHIEQHWQYGHIWKGQEKNGKLINYVNHKTVGYITKYCSKKDFHHPNYKPIILTSSGIGKGYELSDQAKNNKFQELKTREYYRTTTGHKVSLPTYWRNKIYTEEQREKLWLQKLDKKERWICKEKIDISKNFDDYFNTLKHYQALNKSLGYGTDEKNWNEIQYENQLRELNYATRIARANAKHLKQQISLLLEAA